MLIRNNSVVGIDFDGCIVKHHYPQIGDDVPDAIRVIKRMIREKEIKIILLTMRGGRTLRDAVGYMRKHGIELYGANENPRQAGGEFRHSKKVHCDYYIDDMALGCPLVEPGGEKPYVDWDAIEKIVFDEL